MTSSRISHLLTQPTCVVENVLLQPTLNVLDRCAISQTCKTLRGFTSTLYSIFDFPLYPSNITSLSHKKSLAIKPQDLKCVPIIVVRSGVYNVAIGSDGNDYSAIFFNKKGIVRVVKVRTKKDGVSIECLYSVLVQRMLFTCSKFKDRVLIIESPPGKDYFAHTNVDFMSWQSTKPTRDMLLKGIVGMIRRFRLRELANSKEISTIANDGKQRWYINALMQFHYRYLMCQQKLYVYGNSLRKRHTEIMTFLKNEFKQSLLSTFSNEWSYNNESEDELKSSNGIFSFVMDFKKNHSSSNSLSRIINLSSNSSLANNEIYYREAEIEQQLAQLNERHLFLRSLMERFKSVILINQGLENCCLVFRHFELQSIYEDLRTDLTKILHKHEMVSEVIEVTAVKLQFILKFLYEQDIRNKYSSMNKELARQGINIQLDGNDLKNSSSSSRLATYINTSTYSISQSAAYGTTSTTSTPMSSSTTPIINEKRKEISKSMGISHQSDHDLSAESILDALLLQVPFERIFSRKMFIKLLAQRHFETMCTEYGDHTARIDYDDYCSSSNEDLSDDVEIGDWLNAACYIIFIAKLLLKDDCNWVEQYDESEGVCTTEWRFEIVEKIESELVNLTKNVIKPALLKKDYDAVIDVDDMIKVWKTWWLYACSEVLDNIETSNAKVVLEKLEDILEMTKIPSCINKGKEGKE
ncbi:3871_t:CDS:2 [Funneliformis mosseae]|uniref:3871_t:CDS:1 n=1 Tax=Funneliformis mosseae TaxID=27381 RepID=A0A9N9C8J8_FUNMO|nr:3871_t:CDS:2 [Funneliformis mosseae]